MLELLPEPARTVVAVAAFTGLRSGEIRGLRWKDFNGTSLTVERSVWRTHVALPKTADSAAAVPVIPFLAKILDEHGKRTTRSLESYIFAGEKKRFAIHMDNLSRRVIAPKVGDLWKGWHAFRRGLGTNLSTLGVDIKIIQELLRHGSMSTTAKHYLIVDRSAATGAMQKIEQMFSIGQRLGNEQ
jgi:integrase